YAAQWLCEGPYLPLKGGEVTSIAGFSATLFFPDYPTPIPSRPPTKLRASSSSSPQSQAGGKSCEVAKIGCLRSRPPAVFISVRGPPAWLFHEMSSFLPFYLAAGGPWGQDWACSDVRCTTALPPKAEVHPQSRMLQKCHSEQSQQ